MRPASLLLILTLAHAQVRELPEQGAAAAHQALKRLGTTATVLYTTAHPDDEDGALLTWLARHQGVRTGLLTLTRGEGGANLLGPEQYDALGVVRTEELLAAGRYYGVEQFFTRLADFGFSKRLDETLEHWGEEEALREVVRVVRTYRPDVVISRFHGLPRDGHGNHQAAGYLTRKAVEAAADPQRFREDGLRAWKVRKLYLSVRENEPATLRIDTGVYDPLLGRTYREIGREGYSQQRSQGAGQSRPELGPAVSSVRQVLPEGAGGDLFAGVEPASLDAQLAKHAAAALRGFDARQPASVLPEVVAGLRRTRQLLSALSAADEDVRFRLANKEAELVDAGNKLLGLTLEALADPRDTRTDVPAFFRSRETFRVAIPGQRFPMTATAIHHAPVRLTNVRLAVRAPEGWSVSATAPTAREEAAGQPVRARFTVAVPSDAAPTKPHFGRESMYREHLHRITDTAARHQPWAAPPLQAEMRYEIDGVEFALVRSVQTVWMDGIAGEQRRLLTVAPALSVAMTPRAGVVRAGAGATQEVRVSVRSNVPGEATGSVRLTLPAGWTAQPPERPFRFTQPGERGDFPFTVKMPQAIAGQEYALEAVATYAGRAFREGYQELLYRDLEPRPLYAPARTTLRAVAVAVPTDLRVGYIMGVGDEVPEALRQVGVGVELLDSAALATGDLSRFSSILVGIRAYAVRDDLKAYHRRLMEYVERGGHLIVQYQTPEYDAAPYGPYPFQLTRRAEEVSEENAVVRMLVPDHPFFQTPNRIQASDFAGWIEERGSKFMTTWDPRYTALLESHDRNDPEQKGGLLTASSGKGTFTYAAYAFYRQLPAGVPGAFRLLLNLLSHGKTRN